MVCKDRDRECRATKNIDGTATALATNATAPPPTAASSVGEWGYTNTGPFFRGLGCRRRLFDRCVSLRLRQTPHPRPLPQRRERVRLLPCKLTASHLSRILPPYATPGNRAVVGDHARLPCMLVALPWLPRPRRWLPWLSSSDACVFQQHRQQHRNHTTHDNHASHTNRVNHEKCGHYSVGDQHDNDLQTCDQTCGRNGHESKAHQDRS